MVLITNVVPLVIETICVFISKLVCDKYIPTARPAVLDVVTFVSLPNTTTKSIDSVFPINGYDSCTPNVGKLLLGICRLGVIRASTFGPAVAGAMKRLAPWNLSSHRVVPA